MSSLTSDQVKHVAKLAKLTLTNDEIVKFQDQLSEILSYVDELSQADTDNIEPTSQTTGLTNVTRIDEIKVQRTLPIEKVFLNSSNNQNGYFVVNAVIDKDQE